MAEEMPAHAIAIIGYSGRFPGADDLDAFWRNIADGVESLETPSDSDLHAAGVTADVLANPNYVRRSTALDGAANFDAKFFDVSPREAQIIDPQQRIFLECAWEALEHAGYGGTASDEAVGVYAGASMNSYLFHTLRHPTLVESVGRYQLMVANDKDFLCTRVSYKLNLKGPSLTIQTACSTSLVAVVTACQALSRAECDLALAGGVSVTVPERSGYLYEEGMIFSPDGHCRPFDADAQGTRGGAGAGIVVLKRLSEAIASRDTIHAVIRGAAINNDGAGKVGFTAPSIDGQTEVIATAQALAGVEAREISYIETHGTGTPLGDPIEIAALARAFRASTADVGFCTLGSLKANLGHLDAAAGVAGLIKTILALKNRRIPPLVNFSKPNPSLNLSITPFVASAEGAHWVSNGAPRRAGVSSFGIGGTNAHLVLEEVPPAPAATASRPRQLIVLSAKTASALDRAAVRLADDLDQNPERPLADVAWTLQAGRKEFAHRRFVTAETSAEGAMRLREPVASSARHAGGSRPVAFMFSGQGSQHAGMGEALYRDETSYRAAVDACAQHLLEFLGLDIRDVLFGGAQPRINETALAQPAIFVTEYALSVLWRDWGMVPKAMIGHSIGEYVAACLSGVMSLTDALEVVSIRGRLMQQCPSGAMAAIYLPHDEVSRLLPGGIELSAINAPELCTVSGQAETLDAWLNRLTARGAQFTRLVTSHAFHSASMESALPGLTTALRKIALSPPKIPYVSSLTGAWITDREATSPEYYAEQMRRPVRFLAGLRTLLADPSLSMLEVGAGATLQTFARLIAEDARSNQIVSSLSHPKERRPDGQCMLEAAGRMWLAGAPLDWRGLHANTAPARVPLPTYAFERERHWVDLPETAMEVRPAARPDIGQWLYEPAWRQDEAVARATPAHARTWIVAAPAGALGSALVKALADAGHSPILVELGDQQLALGERHYQVRRHEPRDLAALAERLPGAGRPISGALYVWDAAPGLSPPKSVGYDALVALAELVELTGDGRNTFLGVVTFGSQRVHDEPVRDVSASIAAGPVLVLPTEIPALKARLIDFEAASATADPQAVARLALSELEREDEESVVAWRGGRRWLRRFEPSALSPTEESDLPLKTGGVYLITGGLGGIGLTLAEWLARRFSARLVLTGRAGLPDRLEWDRALTQLPNESAARRAIEVVRAIEATGGEALVARADAADREQMGAAIERARSKWGRIDGVIHAAGVAGSGGLAALQSPGDVETVLAPKVYGLNVLTELLGAAPLDFVALMSSVNAIVGAPGACDYTSANAVLDAFAESDMRPPLWRKIISFNWGPWSEVGMAANMVVAESRRAQWRKHVDAGIPSRAGVEAFARALASGVRRIVVSRDKAAGSSAVAEPVRELFERLASPSRDPEGAPAPGASDATETVLAAIWSELLGVADFDHDADFFALGGHSLLATRLMSRISTNFGVRLSLRDIFDGPTLAKLASRINAAQTNSDPTPNNYSESDEEREELVF